MDSHRKCDVIKSCGKGSESAFQPMGKIGGNALLETADINGQYSQLFGFPFFPFVQLLWFWFVKVKKNKYINW